MSADQALSEPMAMDDELLLKSQLCVAKCLEDPLGPNGTRVSLRAAGRKPAASLIGDLPLLLSAEEAMTRSADLLEEFGFAMRCAVDEAGNIHASGLPVKRAKEELGMGADGSGRYSCIGSVEGFSQQTSTVTIQVDKCSQHGEVEPWRVRS
jgi:hypothetical protein